MSDGSDIELEYDGDGFDSDGYVVSDQQAQFDRDAAMFAEDAAAADLARAAEAPGLSYSASIDAFIADSRAAIASFDKSSLWTSVNAPSGVNLSHVLRLRLSGFPATLDESNQYRFCEEEAKTLAILIFDHLAVGRSHDKLTQKVDELEALIAFQSERLQELTAILSKTDHGTMSNTDRLIAKIPIFNGDPSVSAIDTWLDLCKDIFAQTKVLPDKQLPLLTCHLQGDARTKYMQLAIKPITVLQFEEKMVPMFANIERIAAAIRKWDSLTISEKDLTPSTFSKLMNVFITVFFEMGDDRTLTDQGALEHVMLRLPESIFQLVETDRILNAAMYAIFGDAMRRIVSISGTALKRMEARRTTRTYAGALHNLKSNIAPDHAIDHMTPTHSGRLAFADASRERTGAVKRDRDHQPALRRDGRPSGKPHGKPHGKPTGQPTGKPGGTRVIAHPIAFRDPDNLDSFDQALHRKLMVERRCLGCQATGHLAWECPKLSSAQKRRCFTKFDASFVPKN